MIVAGLIAINVIALVLLIWALSARKQVKTYDKSVNACFNNRIQKASSKMN